MYGRNELIARYIKLRTGKTRTRKQVSSHIQVLARRKSREMQSQFKDQATKDKVLQSIASMSSAQIVSAGAIPNRMEINPALQPYKSQMWSSNVVPPNEDIKPFHPGYMGLSSPQAAAVANNAAAVQQLTGAAHIPGSTVTMPAAVQGGPIVTTRPATAITTSSLPFVNPSLSPMLVPPQWKGKQIASQKMRLVNFTAFREQTSPDNDTYNSNKHLFVHVDQSHHNQLDPHQQQPLETVKLNQIYDKFPDNMGELLERGPADAFYLIKFWADLNVDLEDDPNAIFAVSSEYESLESMTIESSTKVCSFGNQVVEKIETEVGRFEKDRYVYRIERSQMCEYMVNFISRLKHLPEKYMMNSVLENFTIQQVITNRETNETLLCLSYIFEVSRSEHGAQHTLFQLVTD